MTGFSLSPMFPQYFLSIPFSVILFYQIYFCFALKSLFNRGMGSNLITMDKSFYARIHIKSWVYRGVLTYLVFWISTKKIEMNAFWLFSLFAENQRILIVLCVKSVVETWQCNNDFIQNEKKSRLTRDWTCNSPTLTSILKQLSYLSKWKIQKANSIMNIMCQKGHKLCFK